VTKKGRISPHRGALGNCFVARLLEQCRRGWALYSRRLWRTGVQTRTIHRRKILSQIPGGDYASVDTILREIRYAYETP
jgi:hypothetical protein